MNTDTNGAGVKFPPPLYFVACLLLAELLGWQYPLFLAISDAPIWAAGFAGVAILLIIWAVLSLHLAKTSIEPWRPTTQLVTSGVFALSRNPIYIAFILLTLSVAIYRENVWVLVFLPLAITALMKWVIAREERYLIDKFEGEYREYCQRVRRWL